MKYQPAIGLEIHVELNTKSKMFCACKNNSEEKTPNLNICPVCLGHPGTLPVINKDALEKVIKTGLALNCQISENSRFDRKNYFYPDLPKGYQISQHFTPFCKSGFLEIKGKSIRIKEVHLEEDTCKLLHFKNYSLIDCNRAGLPLMELVTEPDLSSGKEVRVFAQELQLILRHLGVSNADMEKGQMRVEVNISVSKEEGKLGTKAELKNINSFRSAEKATVYEIKRQQESLESGKEILQETRGWDEKGGKTVLQREKETALDYRYFPEPDLPPLSLKLEFLNKIKAEIPELPEKKRQRLEGQYHLLEKETEILIQNKDISEFFEKTISELPPRLPHKDLEKLIKLTLNYIITDLMALLENVSISDKEFKITPQNFSDFVMAIFKGKITSKTAKDILKEMFVTGADPSHIIESRGLVQITDDSEIEKIAKKVISENPKPVSDYKAGKEEVLQFLIGKVMAASKGKANPEIARKLLKKFLL